MNLLEKIIIRKVVEHMGKTWIGRFLKGDLGWKTILSAIVMAGVTVAQGFGWIDPAKAELIFNGAAAFGFIGLRDAQSRLPK